MTKCLIFRVHVTPLTGYACKMANSWRFAKSQSPLDRLFRCCPSKQKLNIEHELRVAVSNLQPCLKKDL